MQTLYAIYVYVIDLFHAYEYKNAFFVLLKFVPSTVIKGVEKEKVSGTFDEANI